MRVIFRCCVLSRVAVVKGGSAESSLVLTGSSSGATKGGAISTSYPPSLLHLLTFLCLFSPLGNDSFSGGLMFCWN